MTDTTVQPPRRDRFGFDFGIAQSKRRNDIAAARKDGEPFDGLTDRDVALMVERGVYSIMAAQTVRGRFLGDVKEACLTAIYIGATAASEDVIRLFDAIAERNANLSELRGRVRDYLAAVEEERKKDEKERREADAASIVAATASADQGNPDSDATPP